MSLPLGGGWSKRSGDRVGRARRARPGPVRSCLAAPTRSLRDLPSPEGEGKGPQCPLPTVELSALAANSPIRSRPDPHRPRPDAPASETRLCFCRPVARGRRPGPRTRTRGGVDRRACRGETPGPAAHWASSPVVGQDSERDKSGQHQGVGEEAPGVARHKTSRPRTLAKTGRAEPRRPRRNSSTGGRRRRRSSRSRARSPWLRRFPDPFTAEER